MQETRKLAESMAKHGLFAAYYHGKMKPKVKEWVLKYFRKNYFDVIFCTESFGMGIDSPCRHVIEYGAPSDVNVHIQHSGRTGRALNFISRSLVIISAPLVIDTYKLYVSDERALLSYNEAILHFLETTVCRHKALKLWPTHICGSDTCSFRCDVCVHKFDITTVNVVECATVLVGNGLPNESGVIGILQHEQQPLTLTNIINEWERTSVRDTISNREIGTDLRQFIVLWLCASDFFKPVLVKKSIHLHASEARLLRFLYRFHSQKPHIVFKNPV